MPDPLDWLDDALAELDWRALRRTLAARAGSCSPTLQRRPTLRVGHATHKTSTALPVLINFGSNDYLGLAADPRIAAAAREAIDTYGWGAGASPLVTGRTDMHAKLEHKLAEFEGTEAALLFPTGYAANVGTITALVGKGDAIYSDELNHASIIDGCRLSGAAIHVYRHAECQQLERLLAEPGPFRRKLVVTDSLFSMHGDVAPLADIAELTQRFGAMFMVDEAHATGVFGATGSGLCEELGVQTHVHIRMGTLSKALGGLGGFVAGSQRLIDWLSNRARPYIFSTAGPPAVAAAALTALEIVRAEPARRGRLGLMCHYLREKLLAGGLAKFTSSSQIVPVILGEPNRTMAAAAALCERGFFVPAIRPPSVPAGQSLLRISLTALHTEEQIDDLVAALREVAR